MYKIKSINEVPVLKSLAFLGIIKKAMYTLWVVYNSVNDDKINYIEFEELFLNKNIEEQKIELYNVLTMKLSNTDDATEILECVCSFVYQEILDKKTHINRISIDSIEVYNKIIILVMNNLYQELIQKKLIQP